MAEQPGGDYCRLPAETVIRAASDEPDRVATNYRWRDPQRVSPERRAELEELDARRD
jgi:hypothetical protein